jgi:RNA polymerase sigma factor for flagellar operon FliA
MNTQSVNQSGHRPTREEVIRQHIPLVRHIAGRLHKHGGNLAAVSFDDLLSVGSLGLIEAVDRFDWSRGTPFHWYAFPRVRGAMLDMLRELDGMPRSLRRQAKALEQARWSLAESLGREPSARELRLRLGWSETHYHYVCSMVGRTQISLDERRPGDAPETWEDVIADPDSTKPLLELEQREMITELREALGNLPERERTIIRLMFFEERRTEEVAGVLGISTTRLFQLRRRSLASLRRALSSQKAA